MKKLTIFAILILISIYSFGQEKLYKRHLEVRIGISDLGGFMDYSNVYGKYILNLNYRFSKYFGAGIQAGYGGVKNYNYFEGGSSQSGNVFGYVATGTFYISPLIFKTESSKLDLYIRGQIGGQTAIVKEPLTPGTYNSLDYGCYFGLNYSLLRRIGIFGEVGYGNLTYSQFGISFKLSK